MNIGVIGKGFVGEAFVEGMKHRYPNLTVWDIDPAKRTVNSFDEFVAGTDVMFISVPTPMKSDGSCDTSIVESVVKDISKSTSELKIIVIRSTVPPGTTSDLAKKYSNFQFVFNPEFLTEKNYIDDFAHQSRIILGGSSIGIQIVKSVYKPVFACDILEMTAEEAEIIKYASNTFLAMKVSFCNELFRICQKSGVNYGAVSRILSKDSRLGQSHWQVPGPDGRYGFGGTCFPKDLSAFITYAREIGVEPELLEAVWEKNLNDRPEQDWEQSKGRAVSS